MAMSKTKKANQQNRGINLQLSSRLIQAFPREIRDEIYRCLFASTRFASGTKLDNDRAVNLQPAPNGLAILRVCRLVYQEAGPLWLGNVLFSFEEGVDYLNKLSRISPNTLSKIRHIRIGGGGNIALNVYNEDTNEYLGMIPNPTAHLTRDFYRWRRVAKMVHGPAITMKLLPTLNLDTLTIIGHRSMGHRCEALEELIQEGNGWRNLHFITPDSEMLGFPKQVYRSGDEYLRKPQPSAWNSILRERDGADSGASVTIYRSTDVNAPLGSICKSRNRVIYEQKVSNPEQLATFGVLADEFLCKPEEEGKEMLVVVTRGRNANIIERDGPVYECEKDLRRWVGGMSWLEVSQRWFINPLGDQSGFDLQIDNCDDIDVYSPSFV